MLVLGCVDVDVGLVVLVVVGELCVVVDVDDVVEGVHDDDEDEGGGGLVMLLLGSWLHTLAITRLCMDAS